MNRIYSEVRCDHNTGDGFWVVDAWKTSDDNEEGVVVAVINDMTGGVYAINEIDDLAKEVIVDKVFEIAKGWTCENDKMKWLLESHYNLFHADMISRALYNASISLKDFILGCSGINVSERDGENDEFTPKEFANI